MSDAGGRNWELRAEQYDEFSSQVKAASLKDGFDDHGSCTLIESVSLKLPF